MAHVEQHRFFEDVKKRFPGHFAASRVIDCGSLDVNGSLRDLFENCEYTGVDIKAGKNVDVVGLVHQLPFYEMFDTVVSAEMLEHSEHWREDLRKMYAMAKPGGLIAISCAGPGRGEHGTQTNPDEGRIYASNGTHYHNLHPDEVAEVFGTEQFERFELIYNPNPCDTYFWGIKNA